MEQESIQMDTDQGSSFNEEIQQREQQVSKVSETFNNSRSQLYWTNNQVSHLERQLLLNNRSVDNNFVSNWTKVIISALVVIIPGIGQLVGLILGLIFVADDVNTDKRSFGAALTTVSVIVFILTAVFWFLLALSFGSLLYNF